MQRPWILHNILSLPDTVQNYMAVSVYQVLAFSASNWRSSVIYLKY